MGVEAFFRASPSEVRALLSRIRSENIERSLSLSTSRPEPSSSPITKVKMDNSITVPPSPSKICSTQTTWQAPSFTNMLNEMRPIGKEDIERFLTRCSALLDGLPSPIQRIWSKRQEDCLSQLSFILGEQEDLDEHDDKVDDVNKIRVLQWNVLSQAIGTKIDNFQHCPDLAMDWNIRGVRMVEEIVRHEPDVICLQEVDHFRYLENHLSTIGYAGYFMAKPDSPCIHLADNSGPDGCAIFYKTSKFDVKSVDSRVLEICGVQSNQVALFLLLRSKSTGSEFVASTTHLKAKSGAVMSALRNEQARDFKDHMNRFASGRPIICTGDFNCEPTEPAYSIMTNNEDLSLSSAYAQPNNNGQEEIDYTSWKFRGNTEHKEILDYIFYSRNGFEVESVLEPISESEIGSDRLPSLAYASDHISLVADLRFVTQNFPDTF